jgi:hypothetical protein
MSRPTYQDYTNCQHAILALWSEFGPAAKEPIATLEGKFPPGVFKATCNRIRRKSINAGLLAILPPDTRRKISGRFYMLQNQDINGPEENDAFDRPTLTWPGKTVFLEGKNAFQGADALAKRNPGVSFFVMTAVAQVRMEPDGVVRTYHFRKK